MRSAAAQKANSALNVARRHPSKSLLRVPRRAAIDLDLSQFPPEGCQNGNNESTIVFVPSGRLSAARTLRDFP
ncbi:MAG: hypothetical protein P4L40_00645, partial [Terracidiphilus sp.]|nr:hypothetical protein [Terracidiphilus sp.]